MSNKRNGFVPLGDVAEAVALPGDRALTGGAAARRFTRLDQVTQLVEASEADAELGFMARLLALCSLPRTNPGNRTPVHPTQRAVYARDDRLWHVSTKLPFGNLPRLLLAYVTTEAVRTRKAACSSSMIHSQSSCESWTFTAPAGVKHTPDSAIR